MRYQNGQEARLGDKIVLSNGKTGVVVLSVDTDEYSEEFTKRNWGYLKQGILVKFEDYGLIHYLEADPDMKLAAQADESGRE